MTKSRGSRWAITASFVAAGGMVILIVGLVSLGSGVPFLNRFARAAALLGYLSIFFSILSSAYVRQLVRLFGRPFIRMHHVLSLSGLLLITLHPLGAVLDWSDPSILLPRFDSWRAFFRWGGPLAWVLVTVASLAAVLRKPIGKRWRLVHLLSYVAFLQGTIHAILLGTDFAGSGPGSTIARVVAIAMAVAVAAVFARKRFRRRGK